MVFDFKCLIMRLPFRRGAHVWFTRKWCNKNHRVLFVSYTKKVIKSVRQTTTKTTTIRIYSTIQCAVVSKGLRGVIEHNGEHRMREGDKVAGHHNFQAFDFTIYVRVKRRRCLCLASSEKIEDTGRTACYFIEIVKVIRVRHPKLKKLPNSYDNCKFKHVCPVVLKYLLNRHVVTL